MASYLPIPIRELLRGVEAQRLELKSGWDTGPIGEKIVRTICAFANDYLNVNGGYVVLGVEDDGSGRAVLPPKGLDPATLEDVQRQIVGLCHKWLDPVYVPLISPEEVDGRHLLVVHAPGSRRRPHSCAEKRGDRRQYFVRVGAETRLAKGDVLAHLERMTSPVPFDDDRAMGYTLDDLHSLYLKQYLRQAGLDDLLELDEAEVYRLLGLTVKVNDHEVPTNAALLFFHRAPETIFPGAAIRLAHFRDGAGGDLIEERTFDGPIQYQIQDCLQHLGNRITRHIRKHSDRPEATVWYDYPEEAIEEAVVNAVYHRDYRTSRDPTLIRLFPDYLEVTSYPGPDPRLRPEELEAGGPVRVPPARNRRVGDLLRRLHLVEKLGTGVPKIFKAMKRNGSPPPRFDFNEAWFSVQLPVRPKAEASESVDVSSLAGGPAYSPEASLDEGVESEPAAATARPAPAPEIPLIPEILTTVEVETRLLDDVFQSMAMGPVVMVLAQAYWPHAHFITTLKTRAKASFSSANIFHIVPPVSPIGGLETTFAHLGRQCGFGDVKSPLDWEDALDERLSLGDPLFLLITGIERVSADVRRNLGGILASMSERHFEIFKTVLLGGRRLAELKYGLGDVSLLNAATTAYWPELTPNDVLNLLRRKFPHFDVGEEAAKVLLEISGGHPLILRSALHVWKPEAASLAAEASQQLFVDPTVRQLFAHYYEPAELRQRVCDLLSRDDLGPATPWPSDTVLRKLFWSNLVADRNHRMQWRCELLRNVGLSVLECNRQTK